MKKNIIEKELTLEEQVEANRQNINSQIALTDKNTTDINELNIKNDVEGVVVTTRLTGELEDLKTENKENLVSAINENWETAELIKGVNNTQNIRLDAIEQAGTSVGSDYSLLTATGTMTSTTQIIKPIIKRDFLDPEIAINTLNSSTGELTTKIPRASTVRGEFYFNATEQVGSKVTATIQLWNETQSKIIDYSEVLLDFTGGIQQGSGTRTVKGDVAAGDIVSIKVFTDAGNSIIVNSSGMDLEVAVKQGTITTIKDTQIISTNTDLGNGNVAADIVSLNTKKAEVSVVTDINQRLTNIENADLITGLDSLGTRVDATEASITDLSGKVTSAETNITNLQNDKVDKQQQITYTHAITSAGTYQIRIPKNLFKENETKAFFFGVSDDTGNDYRLKTENSMWVHVQPNNNFINTKDDTNLSSRLYFANVTSDYIFEYTNVTFDNAKEHRIVLIGEFNIDDITLT